MGGGERALRRPRGGRGRSKKKMGWRGMRACWWRRMCCQGADIVVRRDEGKGAACICTSISLSVM